MSNHPNCTLLPVVGMRHIITSSTLSCTDFVILSGDVKKQVFKQISELSPVVGNEIEVIEMAALLQCVRRCAVSSHCDHVTISTGNDEKLNCHLWTSNGNPGCTTFKFD